MARKSASAYLPVHLRPKPTGRRIEPPVELGSDARKIFERVVDSLPPDWFHECNALVLAQYAEHVVIRSRLIAQMEQAQSRGDEVTARIINRDLEKGSKLLLSFVRAMRLTQSSTKSQENTKHSDVKIPVTITDAA